jgi:hypothetical protein
MRLREKCHVYPLSFQLFTELKTLPKDVIRIEGNDFEERMNVSGHWRP